MKKRKLPLWAVLLWLLVWQAASMALDSDILLVSPLRVIATLLALLPTARFWASLLGSMARILGGFFLALGLCPVSEHPEADAATLCNYAQIAVMNPIINMISSTTSESRTPLPAIRNTFPGENPLVHPTATNANNPITSAIRIDCPKARQVIMDTTNTPNAIINAMLYSSSPLLKCLAV